MVTPKCARKDKDFGYCHLCGDILSPLCWVYQGTTHTLLNSGPILSNLNLFNSKAQPLQANISCYRDTKVDLLSLLTLYPLDSRFRTEMRERTAQCNCRICLFSALIGLSLLRVSSDLQVLPCGLR